MEAKWLGKTMEYKQLEELFNHLLMLDYEKDDRQYYI